MTKQELLESINKIREESIATTDRDDLYSVRKWYWRYIRRLDLLVRAYLQDGSCDGHTETE